MCDRGAGGRGAITEIPRELCWAIGRQALETERLTVLSGGLGNDEPAHGHGHDLVHDDGSRRGARPRRVRNDQRDQVAPRLGPRVLYDRSIGTRTVAEVPLQLGGIAARPGEVAHQLPDARRGQAAADRGHGRLNLVEYGDERGRRRRRPRRIRDRQRDFEGSRSAVRVGDRRTASPRPVAEAPLPLDRIARRAIRERDRLTHFDSRGVEPEIGPRLRPRGLG